MDRNNNSTINTNVTDIDYVHEVRTNYLIGSYDLDMFNEVKLRNEPVVEGFTEVLKDYDIVAIQGIHDKTEKAFAEYMSEYLPSYEYHISVPLGRDGGYDQYAFIYKSEFKVGKPLLYPDEMDYFDMQPYMVEVTIDGFNFILVNFNIKSTDATQEINHIPDVIDYVKYAYGDNDIFLMGYFAADCYYYDGNGFDDYKEYIDSKDDTTTGSSDCAYNRIIAYEDPDNVKINGFVDTFDDDNLPEGLAEAMSSSYIIGMELEI